MKKLLLIILLVFPFLIYAQEFDKGKEIFKTNCTSCHNMEKKVLGPPLENTVEQQGREWTSKWILNSSKLIDDGDVHANEIYNEYNKIMMPSYSFFSEDELSSLVDYLEGYKKDKESKDQTVATTTTEGTSVQPNIQNDNIKIPKYIWVFIIITLVLLGISGFVIVIALRLLDSYFSKISVKNSYLIKKMNLDSKEVDSEVNKVFEDEVKKRVHEKVKTLKNSIDDKLKDFK